MAENIIRVGMIGCDTSHCAHFASLLNDSAGKNHVPGCKVVAAFPSFSPDVESSIGRVEEYKKTLSEKWGVKMVGSPEELIGQVDAVLLTSVDGRRHLPELKAIASAGKPVFVDKPFAASLADAREMVRIIREHKLPCFSSSSLRFDSGVVAFRDAEKELGKVVGCDAFSPAHLEKSNPGFFWYGVHGVEILYTIMGSGCRSVQCSSTPDVDVAVGAWADGRIGTMRGTRKGPGVYGAGVMFEKGCRQFNFKGDYGLQLTKAVVEFFKTRQSPVPLEDTLEICAFMDAALRSTNQNCRDASLDMPATQPAG